MPQNVITINTVNTKHPDYSTKRMSWAKVRDCMSGEEVIKLKKEAYLPRPKGMDGEYADAYDGYIERAHFPLIVSYALQGALGVVITKLPEFNVPEKLKYILENATKDGRSIQQLFLDIIIESFQTGRVPLLVDIVEKNEFRFVQYRAEDFINWKTSSGETEKSLILGVISESIPSTEDIFLHDSDQVYRVLLLEDGKYTSRLFGEDSEYSEFKKVPVYMGKSIDEIPLFIAGSINNSYDVQPIPLISVANCSIQIYRKEADLANSEFLSCNPTLVLVGASSDDELPNVVGSSVMIVIPNEQARVFYTTTDTAALSHVKGHINDLYEEAIRHGVSILDNRKGVEAAEALRIRQATQSASVYSVYLSAMNAIKQGLVLMCKWAGYNEKEVILDAPSSLTHGIPDSSVIKQIVEGFGQGVIPLSVIHRYLVSSGLLDQTVSFDEYLEMIVTQRKLEIESNGKKETKNENTTTVEKTTKTTELGSELDSDPTKNEL